MSTLRRAVLFVCLALPLSALAQSADQEVVSVVDAPDPVVPGNTLTYTITLKNNGPDPAVNGGINVNLPLAVTYQNTTAPAGFTCTPFGSALSCTTPSLAVGTYVFDVHVLVADSLLNYPDGAVGTMNASPSGTTPDPNSGNNLKSASTSYDSPQIDLALTVSDSPDPVAPNGNITYTINVINNGPDTANAVQLSDYNNGTLKFVSGTTPAGWNCTYPAVNAAPNFSCTIPSLASGAGAAFTLVVNADPAILGINDGSVSTYFGINGTGDDTNDPNNQETETTQYQTPKADLGVSVSDSPDPVTPDNNITYTVQVTNGGPDTATSTNVNAYNASGLQFQSGSAPAGWSCSFPAVGGAFQFTCSNPSFANGGNATFTFVAKAPFATIGNFDSTIQTNFNIGSQNVADPQNGNNSETESTQYDVSDADLAVTATDSPDPVVAGDNITYTGSVTNNGPDTATNARYEFFLDANTLFVSLTGPAGFTCSTPAVGTTGHISCSLASMLNGTTAPFTLITQVNPSLLSGPDGLIQQPFVVFSDAHDPNNPNSSTTVNTTYTTPDADLVVTNSDSPDPVSAGGSLTYTQSITNSGPDTATNATFTQLVPAGTTFQSLTSPAGWSCTTPAVGGTGAINCSKASMTNGEIGAFTLVVNVTGSGAITSTVSGDSDTYDPDPGDNSATASTGNTTTAVLSVTKTTNATTAPVGSTIPYTITLTNNGPGAAANPTMTDVLPASLLFRSITKPAAFTCTTPAFRTNGTVTCSAATLADGASATFTLVTEVASGASGTVVNSATGGGNATSSAGAVTLAPPDADLNITKTTTATQAVSGSTLNYTITVSNAGPSTATNVVVTDTLPASLTLITATPSQGSCNAANPVVCNLGTLLNGASATIALSTNVTGTTGSVSNTATATATESTASSATTPAIPVVTAAAAEPIPTLSEWALMAFAALLGMVAFATLRK